MARSGRSKSRKKGPVTSNKIKYDGINFASGLERYMYMCLKQAKIKAEYEANVYELIPSFQFPNESFEHQGNGKGDFKNRGGATVRAATYKPDFIGDNFIIECKGRPNEAFPMRWKLFKKVIAEKHPDITLYMPKNQADCNEVIKLILERRKDVKQKK